MISPLVAYSITRSITGPIRQAVEHAERIAAGDLTKEIAVTNRSETGQLLQAMHDMSTNFPASFATCVKDRQRLPPQRSRSRRRSAAFRRAPRAGRFGGGDGFDVSSR